MAVVAGREEYKKLVEELPYQHIADTPTVRYYTDWATYEKKMNLDYASSVEPLPSYIEELKPNIRLGTSVETSSLPNGVNVYDLSVDSPIKPMSLVGVYTKMQAYHAYRWNAGVLVDVEDEVDFGTLVIASHGGPGYLGHHIILNIGRGAKGRIILVDHSAAENSLKTLVVEGIAREGSSLVLDELAVHGTSSAVYELRYFKLEKEASIEARILSSGGEMSRIEDTFILEGARSRLNAKASNIGKPESRLDALLNSVHKGEESEGFIGAQGVALSRGYLAQRGMARIDASASWASSEVESHVAILGLDAKGYAVPMLEIHTGDVTKANHSASVTTILEEHVFYMRSRGLSREDLEKLMISGIIEYSGVTEALNIPPELLT